MIDPALCPPQHIGHALETIRAAWKGTPRIAVVLGSGLGRVTAGIDVEAEFPYHTLPHFPRSTALGHNGRLLCGQFDGASMAVMDGRFHFYEGYCVTEIALPICVLHALGVETLVVTNASGGLNPQYRSGDIMAIEDHINLLTPGPRPKAWCDHDTPRLPPAQGYYDPELIAQAERIARRGDFRCHRGVYVGVMGPNYETRAEYRFMRKIGGDAVGMSTVPEVITARHLGMKVLGLSIITNVACPDNPHKTLAEEVCRLAATAEPNLRQIVRGML